MNDRVEFYEKNLERVNYWLQFAEAKNAAMIAFVVAILAVLSSFFEKHLVMLLVVSIVYLCGMIISICSMFPKGNMNVDEKDGEYKKTDNLLYWKDIAKYSKTDYVETVNQRLFANVNQNTLNDYEIMLAEEIIANARIANYKYSKFDLASKVVIVGTVLVPIFLIIIA